MVIVAFTDSRYRQHIKVFTRCSCRNGDTPQTVWRDRLYHKETDDDYGGNLWYEAGVTVNPHCYLNRGVLL